MLITHSGPADITDCTQDAMLTVTPTLHTYQTQTHRYDIHFQPDRNHVYMTFSSFLGVITVYLPTTIAFTIAIDEDGDACKAVYVDTTTGRQLFYITFKTIVQTTAAPTQLC